MRKVPEDIFKYVKKKEALFLPDGPCNRQLAYEIIRVGGGAHQLFVSH